MKCYIHRKIDLQSHGFHTFYLKPRRLIDWDLIWRHAMLHLQSYAYRFFQSWGALESRVIPLPSNQALKNSWSMSSKGKASELLCLEKTSLIFVVSGRSLFFHLYGPCIFSQNENGAIARNANKMPSHSVWFLRWLQPYSFVWWLHILIIIIRQ